MADLFDSLKKTWLKGMEAVGNTASSIAANTKQKVSEMNLESRRREILSDFGITAYEMWQKGERFPEELERQLIELNKLDEELNELRAQRYTSEAAPPEAGSAPQEPLQEEQADFSAQEPSAQPEKAPQADFQAQEPCPQEEKQD